MCIYLRAEFGTLKIRTYFHDIWFWFLWPNVGFFLSVFHKHSWFFVVPIIIAVRQGGMHFE